MERMSVDNRTPTVPFFCCRPQTPEEMAARDLLRSEIEAEERRLNTWGTGVGLRLRSLLRPENAIGFGRYHR